MGKKNKKKETPIYIAPPSISNVENVEIPDYDPQTQIHDPFEDDLDFLLKDESTANHSTVGTISNKDDEIEKSLKSTPKGNKQMKNESNSKAVNVNKKLKKQILNFDISFSSDEDEEGNIVDKAEDIGKPIREIDSEKYLKAELGLDESDSDDDDVLKVDNDEKIDAITDLYEKLQIDDPYDPVRPEHYDEKGDEKRKKSNKSKKKPTNDLKDSKETKDQNSDVVSKKNGESRRKRSRGERYKKMREMEAKERGQESKESSVTANGSYGDAKYDANHEEKEINSKKNKGKKDKKSKDEVNIPQALPDGNNPDVSVQPKKSNRKKNRERRVREVSSVNSTEPKTQENEVSSVLDKDRKGRSENWKRLSKKMEDDAKEKGSNEPDKPQDNASKENKVKKNRKSRKEKKANKEENDANPNTKDSVQYQEEYVNNQENKEKKKKKKKSKKEKNLKPEANHEINANSTMDQLQAAIDRRMIELKKMKERALPHVS